MNDELMLQVAAATFLKHKRAGKKYWIATISSYLNRLDDEAYTDYSPDDVLRQQFSQVIKDQFKTIMQRQFKNKEDENRFKEVLATTSALMRGTLKRSPGTHDLTKREEKKEDMSEMEKLGSVGKYNVYGKKGSKASAKTDTAIPYSNY